MERTVNRRKKRILWIGIPILVLVLLLAGCLIYLESYYHADADAIEAFSVSRKVAEWTLEEGDLVFDPGSADVGLIFYPGGKVEHTVYVPLMRELAANGVFCVLCRMPFRLAVFDMHAADHVREAFPEIKHWYICGHSLGGSVASIELKAHSGSYEGLILLAAYTDRDLRDEPVRVLSVYGSEDRVLNRAKYDKSLSMLPDDFTETVIDGGCHAYFGMYGAQRGDGTPAISNEKQIRITTEEILAWMQNGGADAEDP